MRQSQVFQIFPAFQAYLLSPKYLYSTSYSTTLKQPHRVNFTYLGKFRCLNLSTLSSHSENSVFDERKEVTIDTKLLEDYFVVKNEKKIIAKVSESMRENEPPTISSVIDKNRYTSIYISVNKLSRAFNFEAFLEKVDDVFNESGECNEEAFKILLSEEYQRLFRQTFPTESEITLINSMSNLQTASQTECWLLKIAKNKNIPILIDSLSRINMIIYTLKEELLTLSRYISCYSYLINHDILKTLLILILKISNFLNKKSGKKEEKNFDIRNISNLMTLKINNKQFTDILLQIYFSNSDKTIARSDLHTLHTIIESDQVPMNLSEYSKHQCSLDEIKTTLNSLSLNKNFLYKILDLCDELSLSLENLYKEIEREQTNRKLFLEYFNYPADSKPELIISIVSNCYTLLSKLAISQPKQITPPKEITPQPSTQRKYTLAKENNPRASNLINKYNLN